VTDRALTEEEELEVVIRYKVGSSTLALASRMGVHESTIRRTLDRHQVPRRPRQQRAVVDPEAVAFMRLTGLSWRSIAAAFGCSQTTARNRWKEAHLGS
jgi:transposase